jgi:hypothetical protein
VWRSRIPLIGHISKAQQQNWSQGTPADWAKEAFQLRGTMPMGSASLLSGHGFRPHELVIRSQNCDAGTQHVARAEVERE